MDYKDVKNFTWYKITSFGYKHEDREIRYIYKFDLENNGRDIIMGFALSNDNYNFYWMTLSKEYWKRYDRIKIGEGFPDNLNKLKTEKHFVKLLFETGINVYKY